jgi:hypothetical protein
MSITLAGSERGSWRRDGKKLTRARRAGWHAEAGVTLCGGGGGEGDGWGCCVVVSLYVVVWLYVGVRHSV